MKQNWWLRALGSLAVAGGITGGVLAGGASDAVAGTNPSSNSGCPSGYVAKTLAQWAAGGYTRVPAFLDNPANGGNGDGIVCGNDIGKKDPSNPAFQIYNFTDNDVAG